MPHTARAPRVSPVPKPVIPIPLESRWSTLARADGQPAAWTEQHSGVTLVRLDQHLVTLALHAGATDPGGSGWRYGSAIRGGELHHLLMAFNGGFKFSVGAGGFLSFGRVGAPLQAGLGSVVTYRDGTTAIGAWQRGVPQRGRPIASVRQNLSLLIDHGRVAATAGSCAERCWGATIGGQLDVARAALGIRGDGELVWAAAAHTSVSALGAALVGVGVRRAVELDINPDWVAGYVYAHHSSGPPAAVPLVPGQFGIYGHLLSPYARDFFSVLTR